MIGDEMNYPNGIKKRENKIIYETNYSNRGMVLENELNISNEYYKAIDNCNKKGDITGFIEFMLKMIEETIDEVSAIPITPINNETINVNRLLDCLERNVPVSAKAIMERLNIKSKNTLRNSYLNPAIKQGLVKLTIPDKPNSSNQMYYKP